MGWQNYEEEKEEHSIDNLSNVICREGVHIYTIRKKEIFYFEYVYNLIMLVPKFNQEGKILL